MFIKKTIAMFVLSGFLYTSTKSLENPTLALQEQKDALAYIKNVAKIGAWAGLTHCTTAGMIRAFFKQKNNARLSKQQLLALVPIMLLSGYVYYCLLLKNKKSPRIEKE